MTTTYNVPTSGAESLTGSLSDMMLARAALKGIDLALAEDLREKTSSSAASTLSTITTTTTAPSRRLPPIAATKTVTLDVLTSPRVAQELKPQEVVETVKQVLSFTFPPSNLDDQDPSTFSGYILVSGKQVHWSRQILGQGAGSCITISLREERELLQTDWLETKVFLPSS